MARKRFLVFVTLILVSLSVRLALGQDENTPFRRWTPAKMISDGWWQSITVDQQGTAHIAFYGSKEYNKNLVYDFMNYISVDKKGNWSPLNDVIYTGTGGYTVRNALATTSDGMLFAVFRNGTSHMFAGAPISGAGNANNWSSKVPIDTVGYYVDMISDHHDNLHIVFSGSANVSNYGESGERNLETNPCALCSDLFYRRSTDEGKTWSDAYPLSLESASGNDRPDIFQGRSGRIYINWEEGYDWYVGRGQPRDVRFVYSNDDGQTWSKPIILNGGDNPARRPLQFALTEIDNDTLMAVWRYASDEDRNIYYQISTDIGKTWSKPAPVPGLVARSINDTPLDDYGLITDRLGTVHLFAVGQPDVRSARNATLYHLQYVQGNWLAPVRIFYSTEMRPEWPKAAIGLRNDIHLTWFERGYPESLRPGFKIMNEFLKVYYSYLPGNLPEQAVIAFSPTVTFTPSPTVYQKLDPTETPIPTASALDPKLTMVTTDTYAQETVLGGLFVVGLLCAVVTILTRVIRR
jgi:hypothetical protein